MMPERLAKTDPFKPVTEMIGSGPFRFKANERVPGARNVYERVRRLSARAEAASRIGPPGPKIVHFDRVEWTTIPDAGTAAPRCRRREGLVGDPAARSVADAAARRPDPGGDQGPDRRSSRCMRLNSPAAAVRQSGDPPRAAGGGVSQEDFMTAVAGDDPGDGRTASGIFCPGTPMASDAGIDVYTTARAI